MDRLIWRIGMMLPADTCTMPMMVMSSRESPPGPNLHCGDVQWCPLAS